MVFPYHFVLAEFHQAQFVAAQSVHARAERGNWQIILVDAQSGGKAGQIGETPRRLHGDVALREAPRPGQKARRGPATGRRCRSQRCHALAQQQRQRGTRSLSRESTAQVTIEADS